MKIAKLTTEQKVAALRKNLLVGMVLKSNEGETCRIVEIRSNNVRMQIRTTETFGRTTRPSYYRGDYKNFTFEEIEQQFKISKFLNDDALFKNLWDREKYQYIEITCKHGWCYRWDNIEQKLPNYNSEGKPRDSYKSASEILKMKKFFLQCVNSRTEHSEMMQRVDDDKKIEIMQQFKTPSYDVYRYIVHNYLTEAQAHSLFYRM